MIDKILFKIKSKLPIFTYIILFFSLVSIIILPNFFNFNDNNKNFNITIEDKNYYIQTSSSNPPNKDYFKYFKDITINHNMVFGSGSYKNFPILIVLFDSDLKDKVQLNGNDIAFANDTSWLDHEIELFNQSYNSTHAHLVSWIRIPKLSTSMNTNISLHYGNSTMNSRENSNGVWNNNYIGVWHLSELTGNALDSTSYNTSGIVSGTSTQGSEGKIDGAYNFGTNGQINFGDPLDGRLDMGTGSFTISFWINFNASTGFYQIPLYKGATSESEVGYDFETDPLGENLHFRITDGTNLAASQPISPTPFGDWMYVVGVIDRASNVIRLFKDGSPVGSGVSIAGIGNINSNSTLLAPNSDYDLDGYLDEIRICNIQRSAGWIYTEYSNQNDPKSFFTLGSEGKIDTTPPNYANLIESSDPLELGETEIIQISVFDPSGIFQVKIEFEGTNHSMVNIGGDTWEYDTWAPVTVGNYTYRIYMQDNATNWNSTIDNIEVVDNTPPSYSNIIESSDPLELGETEVIQINASDLSGIFQVKIEFEGLNHSMINIGGDIWQYNSWTPNNWIVYEYKIYIEDNNGNWKIITSNITVQDTITPSPPILTNSPSGDVSGILVFDWSDGFDPSGVAYYILIIDNETDPFITPGYVYIFNISNIGPESSYYELPDILPLGKYYYFLAQIDGVGQQSSYTFGTFTIVSIDNATPNNNNSLNYIITTLILVSALVSITIIVIAKKKSQRKINPPRKKIPLKTIIPHITKLSDAQSTLEEEEWQNLTIENRQKLLRREGYNDEKELEIHINKIKDLGEELFTEGAYLEALKQFELGKGLLLKFGKEEEANLFSELIAGIQGLIEEREKRMEYLQREKSEGNSIKIFEIYDDLIEISHRLRDYDAISMFQSELYQFFQTNKLKLIEIEQYRLSLKEKADSLSNNNLFEKAAFLYEKCEKISQLLVQLGKEEEIPNLEEFRNKKNDCMKNLNNK